ncbi:hypothetical protein KFK09_024302 [Dendrobium nobile]|uniref:chitinase n=1 Tax=Dendrobium nobile TaxID=94219 RepID=A0A8T3ADM2_DENNO|nr:hypothetical protein KFK09_024302 [Dendrobium nobile]
MASPSFSPLSLLTFLLLTSLQANAGTIAVYWGQNGNEGTLSDACATKNYGFVILSFLTVFGRSQTPVLNLAGHCDPPSGTCTSLSSDILSCQSLGIKLLLSLGGGSSGYSLSSADDAKNVAAYLWNNYLGGTSSARPLGSAVLDGIDFDIEAGGADYYDVLAQSLTDYGNQAGKKLYLSAAPQCPYPDAHLNKALATGLFDFVWIQFYNNPPCQYANGNADKLVKAWEEWTESVEASVFFVGLPASQNAAPSGGYIPASDLESKVLPAVRTSAKYGGIMLWSRYYDLLNGYSDAVKGSV